MKKLIIAFVTCFVIIGGYFLFYGIDDSNVIGIQITEDGASRSELKIFYFSLRSDAEKFFKDKNIGKYFLFTKKDGKAEKWFKDLNGLLDLDGSKTIAFLARGDNLASARATAFVKSNELEKISQSSKEMTTKKTSDSKSNFVVHNTYSKEEAHYILMLDYCIGFMDEDFNKFVYSIIKQHPYSYDFYKKNILQINAEVHEKLLVPNIRRENLNYYEIDAATEKYATHTYLLMKKVYLQRNNLNEEEIKDIKKEYDVSKGKLDIVIKEFKNIMAEPAVQVVPNIIRKDASGKITKEDGYSLLNSAVKLREGLYLEYDSQRTINGSIYYLYTKKDDNMTYGAYCVNIETGELYSCSMAMKLRPLALETKG